MKKLLTLLIAATVATTAGAQKTDQAAMMKAWEAYATPGDTHKMLAKSNGKWTTETTMWMDPASAPAKSTGTCINSMIMGGRYQESVFKGNMMGQPFEGRSTLAFDNGKHMFISTWVDNMGTGITTMEGKWDESTRSITFSGMCTDPMTGKNMPMKEVFRIKDDNHQMMEMYMLADGKEVKTMEVVLTRAMKK